ncbi:hypothetical protein RRF57_007150 [Xylaria bambusicola]|uniref:Uncharacterized protein n=1 Tax=Xylaria bambusicola TaxID=326684 RepID=A0AAN7UT94_9PEZI
MDPHSQDSSVTDSQSPTDTRRLSTRRDAPEREGVLPESVPSSDTLRRRSEQSYGMSTSLPRHALLSLFLHWSNLDPVAK